MINVWYKNVKYRKIMQVIISYYILLIFTVSSQILFYYLIPLFNSDLIYYIGLCLFYILNLLLSKFSKNRTNVTTKISQRFAEIIIKFIVTILLYGFFKIWFIAIFSTLITLNVTMIGEIYLLKRKERIIYENKIDTSRIELEEECISTEKSFNHISFGMIPISIFIIILLDSSKLTS